MILRELFNIKMRQRVATKKQYVNVDYLKSLNMICDVSAFNKSNRSRVARL